MFTEESQSYDIHFAMLNFYFLLCRIISFPGQQRPLCGSGGWNGKRFLTHFPFLLLCFPLWWWDWEKDGRRQNSSYTDAIVGCSPFTLTAHRIPFQMLTCCGFYHDLAIGNLLHIVSYSHIGDGPWVECNMRPSRPAALLCLFIYQNTHAPWPAM